MRFATSYWLLVALTATAALAQTHPKKQRSREPAAMQEAGRTRQQLAEKAFTQNTYEGLDQHTQPATSDPNPVYTYVEQMPTLNGQHALFASSAAISHSVGVPADAPAGRVYVQFIVMKKGQVSQPHIVKGLRADLDSAVVAATRQLPRFTPGKQGNRVVAVSITVGVTFPAAQRP
jgi:hypothetical protein